MIINEIQANRSRVVPKKRVGRGGKRGTFSGRGVKGQRARAGHKIRPAERDLIQRLPKLRGIKNRSHKETYALTLDKLEKTGLKEVSLESLKQQGILNKNFKGRVKIVARGDITKPIKVKGIAVSPGAADKIKAAHGTIEAKK